MALAQVFFACRMCVSSRLVELPTGSFSSGGARELASTEKKQATKQPTSTFLERTKEQTIIKIKQSRAHLETPRRSAEEHRVAPRQPAHQPHRQHAQQGHPDPSPNGARLVLQRPPSRGQPGKVGGGGGGGDAAKSCSWSHKTDLRSWRRWRRGGGA